MANFLRGLGQLAGVAGAAIGGYADDQKEAARRALLAQQEERAQKQLLLAEQAQKMAAERDKRDAVQQALMNRVNLRDKGYRPLEAFKQTGSPLDQPFQQIHDAQAKDAVQVGDDRFVAPLESERGYRDRTRREDQINAENQYLREQADAEKRLSKTQQFQHSEGEATRTNQRVIAGIHGNAGATKALSGPIAARVGQAGEMMKKGFDLLPMMESLDVTLANSAALDIAENGVGVGSHRIPGTKGVGRWMANRKPEFAAYQAALAPFVLAAGHATSGVRISNEQIAQIRKSIELEPGDLSNPTVMAQKKKNMIDLMNSINGSLPAEAIAEQEEQMGDEQLKILEGHGYRPIVYRLKTGGSAMPTPSSGRADRFAKWGLTPRSP